MIHCCDVLRGTDSKKVIASGHNRNGAFGKMKGQKRVVIERLMRRLVSDNVLKETITVGFHGMVVSYVQLGKKAQDLLSGRLKIVMDVEVTQKRVSVAAETKSNPAVDKVVKCCYDALIQCRKDIAAEKKVAVHNILSSDTLHEMSEVRPHTVEQLLNITGVTQLKIDFYGAEFLKRLKNFPPGKPRPTAQSTADLISSSSSSNWINTSAPAPSNISKTGRGRARKPRKSVAPARPGNFDKYNYKTPSSAGSGNSKTGSASYGRGAATNSNQNVGFMPMPQPKKPKVNSVHRRL